MRDNLLRMCSLVDKSTARALEALKNQDNDLAQDVINDDDMIDELHQRVEEQVLTTFARQQPVARDLRRIISDLLISNELERMGDHAEGIAQAALRHPDSGPIQVPTQITRMKETVHQMMQVVMEAFVGMDVDTARAAARLDSQMDELYQDLFATLIEEMQSGERSIEDGTYLLWAGHNLERIGDRVTNISERIVYAHTGAVKDFNPKADEVES
jgi:phosphate transport system protein